MIARVFVNKITQTKPGKVIVEASNGGQDGPPFLRVEMEDAVVVFGQRLEIQITPK